MDYPKIDTLFERDPKTFKVTDKVSNPIFNLITEWEITEKIDGTNTYIEFMVNSLFIGGRTKQAIIPEPLRDYITDIVTVDKLQEIFGNKHVIIYGEGCGGKIQAGENDKKRGGKYCDTEKFIVFDILVLGKFWLKREDIENVCDKLGLEVVPCLQSSIALNFFGFAPNRLFKGSDVTSMVDFNSRLKPLVKSEGIIAKTPIPLFDSKGNRIMWKLKAKDF